MSSQTEYFDSLRSEHDDVVREPVRSDSYLQPGRLVDSDHPEIVDHARCLVGSETDPVRQAVRLYYAVRDEVQSLTALERRGNRLALRKAGEHFSVQVGHTLLQRLGDAGSAGHDRQREALRLYERCQLVEQLRECGFDVNGMKLSGEPGRICKGEEQSKRRVIRQIRIERLDRNVAREGQCRRDCQWPDLPICREAGALPAEQMRVAALSVLPGLESQPDADGTIARSRPAPRR